MKPEELIAVHKSVMDELVPTIIRGTTHAAVYTYLLRFGQAHKMFQRGAEREFLNFCIRCHAQAKNPLLLNQLDISDEVRSYLAAIRAFGKGMQAEKAVAIVRSGLESLKPPAPQSGLERVLVERAGPLALASAESIGKFIETIRPTSPDEQAGEADTDEGGGVDPGEIFDADVAGLIAGAAGAAVASWWTGAGIGAATAVGAGAGAVAGSAIEYLEQDARADATEEAEVQASSEGGSVWEGGGDGTEFDSRWHDGDGYGLG